MPSLCSVFSVEIREFFPNLTPVIPESPWKFFFDSDRPAVATPS
jgi:hypothetical protein